MGRPVWIRRFSAVHKSADNSQALSSIQDRLSDFVRPVIPLAQTLPLFPGSLRMRVPALPAFRAVPELSVSGRFVRSKKQKAAGAREGACSLMSSVKGNC